MSEETEISEEGCLSIPELYYEVERPAEVTVKYFTPEGEEVTRHATGRLAVCMQHEIDHLDGVLYIDYLSRLKRDRVNKKFQKRARQASYRRRGRIGDEGRLHGHARFRRPDADRDRHARARGRGLLYPCAQARRARAGRAQKPGP